MTDDLVSRYGYGRNGHSHYGPSGWKAALKCSGYILANAAGTDSAGEDAAYGTVAHDVAQQWLKRGSQPDIEGLGVLATAGGRDFIITVDEAMLFHVGRYIEWAERWKLLGDWFVEQHVDISRWTPIPNQGGTADFYVVAYLPGFGSVLYILDLKMGTGIFVPVERNPQAMGYALGVFEEWDWAYHFKKVVIGICQPRLDYFGEWECSREELLTFGEQAKARFALSWDENAPRSPSQDACQFCNAKPHCVAITMHLDSIVDDSFDPDIDGVEYSYTAREVAVYEKAVHDDAGNAPDSFVDTRRLSTAFLEYRLQFRMLYSKWFSSIYDELLDRAEKGEVLVHFKLGKGRRNFDWFEPYAAREALEAAGLEADYATTDETVSVASARRNLKMHLGMKPKEIEALLKPIVNIKTSRRSLVTMADQRIDEQAEIDDMVDGEDGL